MGRELVLLLLVLSASHAQVISSGGNVTQLDFLQANFSDHWDGLYGQVVIGAETNFSYVVIGGAITQMDLIVQEPPCTVASQSLNVIAVNATDLALPLEPGNVSVLDSIITGEDNGSATFTQSSSFWLSYGNFSNVPTLYTLPGNLTSGDFREGYLNDAGGDLVFVADVVNDRPDWNGTSADYQMILPQIGTNYTLFVDDVYSCVAPPGPIPNPIPGPAPIIIVHRLYILPPQMFTAPSGGTFDADFTVENTGSFAENGIGVSVSCPAAFSCGSGSIPHLGVGREGSVSLPITVDGAGEYVLTVCANDTDTSTCREFIVNVGPQCNDSGDCGAGSFCQSGVCEPKKKPGERCNDSGQCLSGVCNGTVCGYCAADSDCPSEQACSGGSCVNVQCPCGRVSDHVCVSYACCADTDCGSCQICSGNSCMDKKFSILIATGEQTGMEEGQPVRVQILGNDGKGVPGARVFTSVSEVYTDANGYATIPVPYDGIVYASADCYPNKGLMLSVVKKGLFVVPQEILVGVDASIQLVDSRGLPIAGATVEVDGTMLTTDSKGVFHYTFDSPGKKSVTAQAAGYDIPGITLNVVQATSCGYPIVFGLLSFSIIGIWQLWLLSILLAVANFLLLRHLMGRKARGLPLTSTLLQLAYAGVPLLIAVIPGTGFGICLMSNVVTLQLIAELALIAWKKLVKGKPDVVGKTEQKKKR